MAGAVTVVEVYLRPRGPAAGRAADQPGDIHKLDGGGGNFLGVVHFTQHIQTMIRHHYHAGVGFDGAEGIVGGLCAGLGDCVKQCAFANVRQTYDA